MHNKNKKKGDGKQPRQDSTGKTYERLVDSLYMNDEPAAQPDANEPEEDEDGK